MAEGTPDNLAKLLEFLYEGPSYAHVDNVESEYIQDSKHYNDFKVTY